MKPPPALIITHNPTQDLTNHLNVLFNLFENIILVDNSSESETRKSIIAQAKLQGEKIKTIFNNGNLGIAKALNQGFDVARALGFDYIITLDQDSLPTPGMIEKLLNIYTEHPKCDNVAIVAPMVTDTTTGFAAHYLRPKHRFFFERIRCSGRVLDDVSIVITSGAMYNLKICQQLGPFRDDFFIDYVDTEYCLRAKQHGFNIVVACDARLKHKLGDQKKVKLGSLEMRPTFHSITRWYYISRNRIPMIRQYGLRFPHWLLYELVINCYGMLRMLLFEDHKLGKIAATFLGSLDGLTGRMGAIQASRAKILDRFSAP